MAGRMYVLRVGIRGVGGCLGAVIIGCVVYGIQLGWGCVISGLVYLTSSGFSFLLLNTITNIGIYMIFFEQICNNLKMAAIGRNM